MTTRGAEEAIASSEEPERPAFLELFFDLAYVFALIVLTEKLVNRMTWSTAGHVLTLLLAFTMVWALTVWAGNTFDLSLPSSQPQVIGTMAGSLLLAAAAPHAYGSHGLLFAITYVLVHVGSSTWNAVVNRHGPAPLQSVRILFWESIAGIGWIAGGLLAGTGRGVLWAAAVGIEYLGAALGWPVPRLGRGRSRRRRLAGERISERYRQFVIIALGASIFTAGTAFTDTASRSLSHSWAMVAVFLITVLLWRIYIYRAGELMTVAIARSADPPRLSQFAAVSHLIMVAGIIATAAASQLVIEHPFEETPQAWATAILGGPAFFLVGRGLLDYTVFSRVSRSRLAGLVLLGAVAPATFRLPPIMIALLVMVILFLIAAVNLLSNRLHPRDPVPPVLH